MSVRFDVSFRFDVHTVLDTLKIPLTILPHFSLCLRKLRPEPFNTECKLDINVINSLIM